VEVFGGDFGTRKRRGQPTSGGPANQSVKPSQKEKRDSSTKGVPSFQERSRMRYIFSLEENNKETHKRSERVGFEHDTNANTLVKLSQASSACGGQKGKN
jgi:hypothetical protein